MLIDKGANIEAKNKWGQTPLHIAAVNTTGYNVDDDMIKLLLGRGADINARSYDDATLLHSAIGNIITVRQLLANGADLWQRQYELTPVSLAMRADAPGIVRLLMSKGGEYSAVHIAAYFGNLDDIKSYLAKGGNVNAEDPSRMTLLACAVCGGQEAAAELLVNKGADVNLQAGSGRSALHWASMTGQAEMATMLLEKGANVALRDQRGCTALYWAASGSDMEIVEMLLAKGADVNTRSGVIIAEGRADEGWTPLHAACTTDYTAVVELLLAHGADVKAKTKNGCTPLALAQEREFDEIVELLRKSGTEEESAKK
jgi:ankyrin repeat protein